MTTLLSQSVSHAGKPMLGSHCNALRNSYTACMQVWPHHTLEPSA